MLYEVITSRYYKGGSPDLQMLDGKFDSVQPDEKVELARAIAEEVYGTDKRIISVESSYSDGVNFGYLLASNGFEGETQNSWYSLSASRITSYNVCYTKLLRLQKEQ